MKDHPKNTELIGIRKNRRAVMTTCQNDLWDGCCCNCKNHIKDFHHCTTTGQKGKGCVCGIQRGWICMAPEIEGRVFSEWSEHGYCEMYERA